MSNTDNVIEFKNIHHSFGKAVAVENLDLIVPRGERLAILGRTGAGKSTLLNLLVGNFAPTSGTVRVDGVDPFNEHAKLQGKIGMAYQAPRLLPWRKAVANVTIGMEVLGEPKTKKERVAKARMWLEKMNLGDAFDRYPSQLSGGMQQRTSLARAFAINPVLVLLDESFSGLDEVTSEVLREDFVTLAEKEKQTAVIVTHNIEEAFSMGTRVIVLGRPARILAEFRTAEEPAPSSPEFAVLRERIKLMIESGVSEAERESAG